MEIIKQSNFSKKYIAIVWCFLIIIGLVLLVTKTSNIFLKKENKSIIDRVSLKNDKKMVTVSWAKISENIISDVFGQVSYPSAVFDKQYNKTYIAWQTKDFGRKIIEYDNKNNVFSEEVDTGGYKLKNDGHAPPVLTVDKHGYVYIFYGSHGSTQYYKKAVNPGDIQTWGPELSIPGGLTYPNPIWTDDKLWLFYRTEDLKDGAVLSYRISEDGKNWGSENIVIRNEGANWNTYFETSKAQNGDIHLTWLYYHYPNLGYFDVYHIYYDVSENKWKRQNGGEVFLPVSRLTADKVFVGNDIWLWGIQVDDNNNPYILFGHSLDKQLKLASWTNNEWLISNVTELPWDIIRHFSGALKVDNSNNIRIITTDIEKKRTLLYKSIDGGKNWLLDKTIGENTGREYYCCHQPIVDGSRELEFILAVGEGAAAWGQGSNFTHEEIMPVNGEGAPCRGETDNNELKRMFLENMGNDLWMVLYTTQSMETLNEWCRNKTWSEIKSLAEEVKGKN